MSNKFKILLFAGVFALFIGGSVFLYDKLEKEMESVTPDLIIETDQGEIETDPPADKETETGEEEKVKAPDFNMVDIDGNSVKLSDFEGKPVVLNFWASWCPPCKEEMPYFDKMYGETGEEIQFLMVSLADGMRETVEKGKAHIAENGYSFPIYFDVTNEASMPYGLSAIPTTFFLDAEGYLVAYVRGAIDEATLLQGIGMLKE